MSDRLAILIGNGRFDLEPSLPRLSGARRDVTSLGELLSDPAVGNFVVFELLDRESAQLQPELERILSMGHEGSTVVVFYAGYVLTDPGRGLFLATADTDIADLKRTALPVASIKSLLRSCGAPGIVVILDCCYVGPSGKVDPFDVEQQLRRIRTDVGPDVHVIASPPSNKASETREITTDAGSAGRLSHCIVEGLATGAADRDGDNRTGARDLNEYLGMRLGEHRPLWSGPLDGTDLVIVANPNPIEGVDLDAFRPEVDASPRRDRRRLVMGGLALATVSIAAASTAYLLTGGSGARPSTRLEEFYAGSGMPEDVAIVDGLVRLRSVINLTGWVEHVEPLDGSGPRYPDAMALGFDSGDAAGTMSLGLGRTAELDFGTGVHGFGLLCADGVNLAEVRVELVDGRRYVFEIRAGPEDGELLGFVSRDPLRHASIRSKSTRFVAERIYVYADREFEEAAGGLR